MSQKTIKLTKTLAILMACIVAVTISVSSAFAGNMGYRENQKPPHVISKTTKTFTISKDEAKSNAKYEKALRVGVKAVFNGITQGALSDYVDTYVNKYYKTSASRAGKYTATVTITQYSYERRCSITITHDGKSKTTSFHCK